MTYDRTVEVSRGVVNLKSGITVPYLSQGDFDGMPVVLLHAWGESKESFARLLPNLPAGLRAFAIDLRGHGDAGHDTTDFAAASLASDVDAFMEFMHIRRAVVVGSSSGGYIAQYLAVAQPARVATLVLIGSPRSLQTRPPFADEVEALADPIDPAWVQEFLAGFPLIQPVPKWYLEQRVADGLRMPAAVWKATLAGLISAAPPTEHGTITAPTLILWGEKDGLIARDEQVRLESTIPHARLIVYEDTGHLVLWERPDRVAADLVRFLTEQRST